MEVVDAWGRPVPYVEVIARRIGAEEERRVKIQFSGVGDLELLPRVLYRLELIPDSPLFEPAVREAVRLEDGRVRSSLSTNAVRVSGVVRREDAESPEPFVLVTASTEGAEPVETWCSEGRFDVLVAPQKSFALEAWTPGWRGSATVEGGNGAWLRDVEVVLRSSVGGILDGTVTDRRGAPIENAWVELWSAREETEPGLRRRTHEALDRRFTGSDGSFRFEELGLSRYKLQVTAGGYLRSAPISVDVVEGVNTTRIQLIQEARLRFRPLSPEGLPTEGGGAFVLSRGDDLWTGFTTSAVHLQSSKHRVARDRQRAAVVAKSVTALRNRAVRSPQGPFDLEGLEAGHYTLTYFEGEWRGEASFTAIEGQTAQVDVPLVGDGG